MKQIKSLIIAFFIMTVIVQQSNASKNPFEILGLNPSATKQQVRQAFKQLSLKYHPDRSSNSKQKYQAIINAYQFIKKNPQKYGNISEQQSQNFKKIKDIYMQIQRQLFMMDVNMFYDDSQGRFKQGKKIYDDQCQYQSFKQWINQNGNLVVGGLLVGLGLLFLFYDMI